MHVCTGARHRRAVDDLRSFFVFFDPKYARGKFLTAKLWQSIGPATILRSLSDLSFRRWPPSPPPTNAHSPSNCSFCTSSTTPTTTCSAEPLGHTPIYNLNTCTCAPQTPTTTSASSMSSLSRSPPAHLDKSSRPRSTRASA